MTSFTVNVKMVNSSLREHFIIDVTLILKLWDYIGYCSTYRYYNNLYSMVSREIDTIIEDSLANLLPS